MLIFSVMKMLGESRGIEQLREIREEFRVEVGRHEVRAKNCGSCDTPGACCLDEHFVNVRITRLEAAAIGQAIGELTASLQERVFRRVENTIKVNRLTDSSNEKFACPLFEKGVGCLVHTTAKPLPCIQHACYERQEDLPPDELLMEAEEKIDRLNRRVYGKASALMPLPVAVEKHLPANNANRRE